LIVQRIVLGVVSLALLAACAVLALFAGAFAVYALLRGVLTPPGAAGAVILLAAVVAGIAAFILSRIAKPPTPRREARKDARAGGDLLERALELAQQRPFIAAGAAVGAGLLALANPAVVTAVIRAFVDRKPTKRR
jgi:hypothetical protein